MLELTLACLAARKCARCGESTWSSTCASCLTRRATLFRTPSGHSVRALGTYQGPPGESVRRLKYQDETIWAAYLGSAMQYLLPQQWHTAVLIPVPLHPERLAERGFNQAALLARALGRRAKLKVAHDWISRTRHTPAQARLGKSARAENLKQGFHCRALGGHPQVVLVDDVVTTGHTIDACAQALMHSGAQVLGVLSCAVARELPAMDELSAGL